MIIDTHQHVFWNNRDDAGLIRDMDEHGIDLAWLLTWEIPAAEDDPANDPFLDPTRYDNGRHKGIILRDLLAAAKKYPGRFVLGYCPDPSSGRAADLFEAACHIHNVRVCGEWKFRMHIDDPRCIELFRRAGKLGCPVVLHLGPPYLKNERGEQTYQPCWYGGTIDNLERAMQQCPRTIFIGHAPGFWREISGDAADAADLCPTGPVTPDGRILKLLDSYPNLYADLSAGSGLSALQRDRRFARDFIIRYSHRLLFARDIYGGDLAQYLRSLDLPVSVMKRLHSENAEALVDHTVALAGDRQDGEKETR